MIEAARHVQREWPHVQALPSGERVPSPCNNVCRIDAASGLCEGCLRTIDEVVAWGASSEGQKFAVWQLLEQRAQAIIGRALTPTLSRTGRE